MTEDTNAAEVEALEAPTVELKTEGEMVADLRELVIRYIKDQKTPWSECSEARQKQILADIDRTCEDAVRSAVRTIVAHQWPGIAANVEQVVFKDGIKAVMTIGAGEPSRHELADRTGASAMIVIADPKVFMTAKGTTVADPDQPSLPLGEDGDGDGDGEDETDTDGDPDSQDADETSENED